MKTDYQGKPIEYFSNVRYDLISLLPAWENLKVLEIGAGGGDTILELKRSGRACEVAGIELMRIKNSNQEHASIDKFFFGNIETDSFEIPNDHYDAIICGDVLEHLLDPWIVVSKIKALLRHGGILIISCPNIRHFSSFKEIFIRGSFPYSEQGLFDKTHFRFFCKRDLQNLVQSGGLKLKSAIPLFKLTKSGISYNVNKLTLGVFEEFLSLQYAIVAEKV